MRYRLPLLLVLIVMVVVSGSLIIRSMKPDDATALADPSIPVILIYHEDSSEVSEGDVCQFPNRSEIADAEGRIVVRDGEGHIIAISDTVESTYEPVEDSSLLVCTTYHFVLVPESPFYDVYWGDTWITAVALDDIPFREPIQVSLD